MAIQSKEEYREEKFNRIREDAQGKMCKVIGDCTTIMKTLALPKKDIPNIITAYNNRILVIEREFKAAGIDFYDREQCETRFIIEQYMEGAILLSKNSLSKYFYILSAISDKQKKDFLYISKKLNKSSAAVRKAMKNRQHPLLTNDQMDESNKALNEYLDFYDRVADFTISNDIVEAILFYKVLAYQMGVYNFNDRIDSIDAELQKLGYESIKDIVLEQMKTQDLSFRNIIKLKSVPIQKKVIQFRKKE